MPTAVRYLGRNTVPQSIAWKQSLSHYRDDKRVSAVLRDPHAHNQFPVLIIIAIANYSL